MNKIVTGVPLLFVCLIVAATTMSSCERVKEAERLAENCELVGSKARVAGFFTRTVYIYDCDGKTFETLVNTNE